MSRLPMVIQRTTDRIFADTNREKFSAFLFPFATWVSIVYWWRHCWFSPDSTNYLTAAENFLETGKMFVFANWPSFSMAPAVEAYRVQPYGYPLYLSFFVAIFRDPFWSAVLAQSFAIGVFFIGLWQCVKIARWRPVVQISFFIFLLSFESFAAMFGFLWTEPLFIGLNLLLLASVHRLFSKKPHRREGVFASLILFSVASLRFTGVFGLGFFVPALLRKKLRLRNFIGLCGIALLPSAIWQTRNQLAGTGFAQHYGWIASWTDIFHKAFNIIESLTLSLGYGSGLVFVLLLCFIGFLGFQQYAEKARGSEKARFSEEALAGLLVHFFGLSGLAVFSEIGNLIRPEAEAPRLLATVYLLFFVWLHCRVESFSKKAAAFALVGALAIAGNYPHFSFRSRLHVIPKINIPLERDLWKQIETLEPVARASFFYSDYDFVHQIFSGKIQRVLWAYPEGFGSDPKGARENIEKLFSVDGNPFILIRDQSEGIIRDLEKYSPKVGLKKIEFPEFGFRLYHRIDQ